MIDLKADQDGTSYLSSTHDSSTDWDDWDDAFEKTEEKPKVLFKSTPSKSTGKSRVVAKYIYRDPSGNELYKRIRYEPKNFGYQSKNADGRWINGLGGQKQTLYRLPEVINSSGVIHFCEGEKDTDNLVNLGLVATTSGSSSSWTRDAAKQFPKFLKGREVVIYADNDTKGGDFAEKVAKSLHGIAKSVKVIYLPDLPEKGDVSDWLDDGHTVEELNDIIAETPEWSLNGHQYIPFPIEVFSETTRQFIIENANVIGFDPAYIAVPMLPVLASAVGDAFDLAINSTWKIPPVIWSAIVVKSGGRKSAGFDAACSLLNPIEADYNRQFRKTAKLHKTKMVQHKEELAAWKKEHAQGELPPEEPVAPTRKCLVVDDTTTEVMPDILSENPYGILVAKDELSGFFASFDAYKKASGKDAPFWLSIYDARTARVDRKNSGRTYVERPIVSIAGTIQPAIFKSTLIGNKSGDGEHIENGMAARFVIASPPVTPKVWSTSDVSKKTRKDMEDLVCKLVWMRYKSGVSNGDVVENEFPDFSAYTGDPFDDPGDATHSQHSQEEDDRPERITLTLKPEADDIAREFVNDHGEETFSAKGPIAFVWPKLESIAFRVALVLHVVDEIETGKKRDGVGPVSADAVRRGIRVARWFGNEARRLYSEITSSTSNEVDTENRDLVELIAKNGGRIKPRELAHASTKYRKAGVAQKALDDLVADGYGSWGHERDSENGKGRQPTYFILSGNRSP